MTGIPITITHRAMFIPHSGMAKIERNWKTNIEPGECVTGSDRLGLAMIGEFKAMALRHGITVQDASLLLMNGVGL